MQQTRHLIFSVKSPRPLLESKYVLTADAGNNWYLLGFEFQVEDQKLQGVDQVHLNEDGKIDQLIGYMRPIPVAQKFAELVGRRLQPT